MKTSSFVLGILLCIPTISLSFPWLSCLHWYAALSEQIGWIIGHTQYTIKSHAPDTHVYQKPSQRLQLYLSKEFNKPLPPLILYRNMVPMPPVLGKYMTLYANNNGNTRLDILLQKKFLEGTTDEIKKEINEERFLIWHKYHLATAPLINKLTPHLAAIVSVIGLSALAKKSGFTLKTKNSFINPLVKISSGFAKAGFAAFLSNTVYQVQARHADDAIKNDPELLQGGIDLFKHRQYEATATLHNPEISNFLKLYIRFLMAYSDHLPSKQRVRHLEERVKQLQEQENKTK